MPDPVSAIATAVPRVLDAVAAFAVAVRPDAAVAAARAARLEGLTEERNARHVAELVGLRQWLREAPPTRRNRRRLLVCVTELARLDTSL